MIKEVILYQVFCDACGKLFDNEEPKMRMNECHLYTSLQRAHLGIQKAGWAVTIVPNRKEIITCKSCIEKTQQIKRISKN